MPPGGGGAEALGAGLGVADAFALGVAEALGIGDAVDCGTEVALERCVTPTVAPPPQPVRVEPIAVNATQKKPNRIVAFIS